MLKSMFRAGSKIIAASAVILAVVSPACYAVTTTQEISIQCSENDDKAIWHEYEGKPGVQYILTTKGIREAGVPELVTEWDIVERRGRPHIGAKCSTSSDIVTMWPSGNTLACKKGEGLLVMMFKPNNPNPNKYQYVADLTRISDEEADERARLERAIDEEIARKEAEIARLEKTLPATYENLARQINAAVIGANHTTTPSVRREVRLQQQVPAAAYSSRKHAKQGGCILS